MNVNQSTEKKHVRDIKKTPFGQEVEAAFPYLTKVGAESQKSKYLTMGGGRLEYRFNI